MTMAQWLNEWAWYMVTQGDVQKSAKWRQHWDHYITKETVRYITGGN